MCREREGRWSEAKELYSAARQGADDSEDRRTLDAYLGQLNRVFTASPAAPGAGKAGAWPASLAPGAAGDKWFTELVSVLPFANETNNMDAPERARKLVRDGLAQWGYPVLALDETDRRLRELGLSDGGQVRAFQPRQLADAAGANRVLIGTLKEFKTVNVGLYNLHHVALALRLQDAEGRVLWESEGVGYREILVRPADAGKAFLGGLIESAVGKVTGSDLSEELEDAVLTGISSLPVKSASSGR